MSRRSKIFAFAGLGVVGLALVVVITAVVIARTEWFKNKVRERIVSVAERATGGRVEIGKFDYQWHGLTAEAEPFILHGREPSSGPPLFRAGKIQVGLRILSVFKREVDIESLIIENPQLRMVVAPDGATNVPTPKIPSRTQKNFVEELLDLKVKHFELRNGFAQYNEERIPLEVRGDNLNATLRYEAAGPRYVGEIASRQVHASSPGMGQPLAFDLETKLALDKNRIQIERARLSMQESNVDLSGAVDNLSSPRGGFDVTAKLFVKDFGKAFRLPIENRGGLSFSGKATFQSEPFAYKLEGKLAGRELAYRYGELNIGNIALSSRLEIAPGGLNLPNLDLSALNGHYRGSAQLLDWKSLNIHGTAQGFSLRELGRLGKRQTGELNGTVSGPVQIEGAIAAKGLAGMKVLAKLDIVPGAGGVPVQGAVQLNYDQRAGKVQLGNSNITIGSTTVNATGTLGESLSVHGVSKNLNDLLAAFPLFGEKPPKALPITLKGGLARFDGSVIGPIDNARATGQVEMTRFAFEKRDVDRLTSTFEAGKSEVIFHALALDQGKMRIEGQGRIGLVAWKIEDASAISALVSVRGADLQKLAAENGNKAPVSGIASATIHVSGTVESPLVTADVEALNVTAYDEHFDRARADITLTNTALEVANGDIRDGPARITVTGAYNHPAKDWESGELRFDVTSSGLTLAQIDHVNKFRKGLAGQVDLKAAGTAKIVKSAFDLTSLNGQFSLKNAVVDGRPYGNLLLTASTKLPTLSLTANVDLRGVQIRGTGQWKLEGDYPGQAQIEIPRITFATLHDLAPGEHARQDLPFEGFLQGTALISGPLMKLDTMKADVTLTTVQMNANPSARPMAGAQAKDLALRNDGPIVIQATPKSIDIKSAKFVAKDTTVDAFGRLALDSKNPWNLSAKGVINLAILQIFNPDLLASGTSIVNVSVRGSLDDPQVDGRLELKDASLFVRDFPNGVDQANGLILFDRNRATVDKLTGMTGGGTVTFQSGSFVGFRGAALLYKIQASADNVRYRSPDGVSVTVNALMNLNGTSERSVLAGSVTVVRAGFNPRTDVGSLLASTAKPVSVPSTPNEYLRGIQFDVRVLGAQNLEVQTSLTRNIEAEVNLRLRGTSLRPVILGNVSVNSGEIEFFGNKYTINRGEVNFYNPSKIEPIIDMDLEARVRGITVDINFSGPLNKLNFSYRSDPPLETNQIVALLAVGRVPTTVGSLASSQTVTNTSYLATGSNALVSQAIAPVSGRLQRFFGVSHIKIDPQLTDLTSLPQARLTLEQQISKDITLTYITNLARTQEQIIRVEWDLSKQWSVIALRDENGAFGIDFQYRKRFK